MNLDEAVLTPTPARPHAGIFRERQVLLVEDSPDNQVLICAFLRETKAEITIANNGREGVEIALKNNFDLILMDIQMPFLDGFEATRAIRASGSNRPIVAMTAHAMQDEKLRCLKSGFTAYVSKPLNRKLLIETMHGVI